MEEKELEELAFVFQVGQLVLHTAKSIIKDENLLGSNGTFALKNPSIFIFGCCKTTQKLEIRFLILMSVQQVA